MSTLTVDRQDTAPDVTVEHWNTRIRGYVHGVGFCDACVQVAKQVGITGWVRNRRDGSIEVELHGTVDQLLVMRRWLAEGPVQAEVRNIEWRQSNQVGTPGGSFHRRLTA